MAEEREDTVLTPRTTPSSHPTVDISPCAASVAMVSTYRTQCGIADYTADLSAALAQRGVATATVAIDRERLHYMTERELHTEFARLAAATAEHDIVHVQHEYGFFAGAYGWGTSLRVFTRFLDHLRARRTPVVVTMHTEPVALGGPARSLRDQVRTLGRRHLWWELTRRVGAHRQVQVVVHSRTTRRRLIEVGLDPASIHVMSQGVREMGPEPAATSTAAQRSRLGIPPEATVLGIFGFLSRYKGYHLALEAMLRLPEDCHLLIIGAPHPFGRDSALEDVLHILEKRRKLRGRVHLAGFVPQGELAAYRACVDICLAPYLTSARLSSSAAVSWGLASGRPVIASRIAAFEELAQEAGCLQLVEPERPRELAFAIEHLISTPQRSAELVAAAARHCAANTWSHRAADHLELYAAVRSGT